MYLALSYSFSYLLTKTVIFASFYILSQPWKLFSETPQLFSLYPQLAEDVLE